MLLDWLADGASTDSAFLFQEQTGAIREWSNRETWSNIDQYVAAVDAIGGRCSAILTNSPEAACLALGCVMGGHVLQSLPMPGRGQSVDGYLSAVTRLCHAAHCPRPAWVDDDWYELAGRPAELAPLSRLRSRSLGREVSYTTGFELIQHSSGTTGPPSGIRIGAVQLEAQVRMVLGRIQPDKGDVACTWVPLSHDMGLVGSLLVSASAASRAWAGGGRAILLRTERFLRSPRSWLTACSEFGATVTAGPAFAYARAASAWKAGRPLRLRACMVGGEMIAPTDLRAFELAAQVDASALCPSWGLAEASLAVSMDEASEPWRAVHVDSRALDGGEVVVSGGSNRTSTELVLCGAPLSGIEVAASRTDVSPLRVKSPAVGTTLDREPLVTEKGWLETGDVGFLVDDQIVVVGREADTIVLGGANYHAVSLERSLSVELEGKLPGLEARNIAVIPDRDGYSVVVESSDPSQVRAVASRIADVSRSAWGMSPRHVLQVELGALPRTPSGKLRRLAATRRDLASSSVWVR